MVGHWLLGVCPLSILALVLLVLNAFMASFTAAKVRSEEYGQPSHPWLCGVPQLQQPGDCNFFSGLEQRRNLFL